ncbi:sporulation protein YtxC [Aquisalibacillus elongatus]|uniref:Putative sporulation protein YtxC n=1 Tax=Aquisalibacillus elongatus TaxID=485577 RepID=A0A3N5C9X6_9BACI|nr:sporulation protein YtxC [Aquisalibacillus elongatus]RPF55405.1 putative sporulation protein YtxC [Aquisalibacillus elongatus]
MKETLFLFQDEKDANLFYSSMSEVFDGTCDIKGSEVRLSHANMDKQSWLADFIFPFIVNYYVPRISSYLLKNTYYYHDDEIEQIIPFVLSVSSISKELHTDLSFSLYERLIYYLYTHQTRGLIDMKHLYLTLFQNEENWIEIVGYGIEEWQFELNFQEKMNDIREYVSKKKPKLPKVVINIKEAIRFYDSHGQPIREEVLKHFRKVSGTTTLEDYDQSKLISTLISIAPQQIDVYASNDHMHTLYWMMNIFQERVKLFPVEQFPFKLVE